MTGRSSIPETAAIEPRSRGVLDGPHEAGHDSRARRTSAFSRHGLPEVCKNILPRRGSRECRVRAAPAVSCAKLCEKGAHEHTGSAETLRHPPRNGFTAYIALSSATNSSCHRRCRLDGASDPVGSIAPPTAWHQQRVSGPHGFAVRISVVRPGRRCSLTENRPANIGATDAAASTASFPTFVTTRDRPSCRARTGRAGSADLPDATSGIFS
jgi:hypothetical protein